VIFPFEVGEEEIPRIGVAIESINFSGEVEHAHLLCMVSEYALPIAPRDRLRSVQDDTLYFVRSVHDRSP
jgi:hypothetical protein